MRLHPGQQTAFEVIPMGDESVELLREILAMNQRILSMKGRIADRLMDPPLAAGPAPEPSP